MASPKTPKLKGRHMAKLYDWEDKLFELVDGKVEGMKAANARRKTRKAQKKRKSQNISTNSSSTSDLTCLDPLPDPVIPSSSKPPRPVSGDAETNLQDPFSDSEEIVDREPQRHTFPPRTSSTAAVELMERMKNFDSFIFPEEKVEEKPTLKGASAARIQQRALLDLTHGSPEAIIEQKEKSILRSNSIAGGKGKQLIPSSDPYSAAVADWNLAKENSASAVIDDLVPKPLVIRKRANSRFTEHID